MTHNSALPAIVASALLSSGPLGAQTAEQPENAAREIPEEVIVRGRRLADFRAELQAAQIRVFDLFNDLNSDDAFAVHCRVEDSTGTRMRQQVCRPQFANDTSSGAAAAWVNGIKDLCLDGLTQECIFGHPGAASQAKSAALAVEGREPLMQKLFAAEMARVVRDSPEMQQALMDYEAVERAYADARSGRRGRVRAAAR